MPDEQATLRDLCFLQWLADQGHKQVMPLPGGRWAAVLPLMYTHAIVTGPMHDKDGYDDRWCYETLVSASAALQDWAAAMFDWRGAKNAGEYVPNRRNADNG